MSSRDLNQVVAAQSSTPGVGTGEEQPVPDEAFGYLASEEYARSLSQTVSRTGSDDGDRSRSVTPSNEGINRDENDHSVIHLDPQAAAHPGYHRSGTSDMGESGTSTPAILQMDGSELDPEEERQEYSIIAEDEAAKRHGQEHLQPAVSPVVPSRPSSRRPHSRPASIVKDSEDESEYSTRRSFAESRESLHTRTPLEILEDERAEGESSSKPLFSDDEDKTPDEKEKPSHPMVAKLKRPDLSEHRFPSNDVWEEAPEYSQLEATVSHPPVPDTEINEEDRKAIRTVPVRLNGEKEPKYIQGQPHYNYEPGDEAVWEAAANHDGTRAPEKFRSNDVPDERLSRLLNPSRTGTDSEGDDSRSASRVRNNKFPSNDLWEDVPESLDLETTIDPTSPEKERASTGDASTLAPHVPDPAKARLTTSAPLEGASTAPQAKPEIPPHPSIPARPSVPARPQRPQKAAPPAVNREPSPEKERRVPPSIPSRPKPVVPAHRPAITKRTPSQEEPPAKEEPRARPSVPPRTGGKIAALKADFLGNLESRLKLGPMAPKKEEPKNEEKPPEKPLEDMRKGRARGPQRRAPTAQKKEEPAPATKTASVTTTPSSIKEALGVAGPWTVWTFDESLDAVVVGVTLADNEPESKPEAKPSEPAESHVPVASPTSPSSLKSPEALKPASPDASSVDPFLASPTAATSTLPGVAGTGDQADAVVAQPATPTTDPARPHHDDADADADAKPNPTLLNSSQHPEDALPDENGLANEATEAEIKAEEVVGTPVPSRVGTMKDETLQQPTEAVNLDRVDQGLGKEREAGEAV